MSGFIAPGPSADRAPVPEDFAGGRPIQAPLADVLQAQLRDAIDNGPGFGLFRSIQRAMNDRATVEYDPDLGLPPAVGRMLQPDEANRLFGIEGHLRFTDPLSEDSARQLNELKRAELARRDIFSRADSGVAGWSARLAVGLVGGAVDPLNLASAFIPVVSAVRAQAMLAQQATRLGRVGVAARIGAAEGAVGQALLEPVNRFVASQEQRDYTMADSLLNVAFGAVLGGLLHGGGRALVDGWRGWAPDVPPAVMRETHDAAMRAATAQVVRGDPVNVDPLLRAARDGWASERAELMGTAARVTGEPWDAAAMRVDMPAAIAPEARMDAPAPTTAEMLDALRAARPDDPEVARLADEITAASNGDSPAALREGVQAQAKIEEAWRALPPEARGEPAQPPAPDAPAEARPATVAEAVSAADARVEQIQGRNAVAPVVADVRALLREAGFTERPRDVQALQAAEAARARQDGGTRVNTAAAKIEGEVAAVDTAVATQDATLRQMLEQGRITEADMRALDMTDAEARTQERVKGIEAAAACLVANGA